MAPPQTLEGQIRMELTSIIHACGFELQMPPIEGEMFCPSCGRPVLGLPPPHVTYAARQIGSITGLQVELLEIVTRAYYKGWDAAMGKAMTDEIDASPEEVKRLRESREQARTGQRTSLDEVRDDGDGVLLRQLRTVRSDLDRVNGILGEVHANLAHFLDITPEVAETMSIVDLVTSVRVLKQEHDLWMARAIAAESGQ